jgi:hypothetical protein
MFLILFEPPLFDHLVGSDQSPCAIDNFTEQARSFLRCDCRKICPGPFVIMPPQPDRMAVMIFTVVSHVLAMGEIYPA